MCLAVIYNLVTIIGRAVFWQMQNDYLLMWTVLDYFADLLYLLDMYITSRTGKLTAKKSSAVFHKHHWSFWFQVFSIKVCS